MKMADIRNQIDSCVGKTPDQIEVILNGIIDEMSSYVLQSYEHSREILQFAIGQFERIHDSAVYTLMSRVLSYVEKLAGHFEKASNVHDAFIQSEWNEMDFKAISNKLAPYLSGDWNLPIPNVAMIESLTKDERRKMVCCIIESIQYHGASTQWNKDIIENHQLHFFILYSICKVEYRLPLLFYFASNFIERLATTQLAQDARDLAENMLVIGHQEGMEAEAYFCASRAYTILHQPLAGLLYMKIALRKWVEQNEPIHYKLSFEILWQVLKLFREIRFCSEKNLEPIVWAFETLSPLPYDILSFYHTYYSLTFSTRREKILNDIADFLDAHREIFFENLEHSAMPWITLIASVKMNIPDADFSSLLPYIHAARGGVDYEKNALYLDLFEHKNEDKHLKELLVRLDATRNVGDYSHDNHLALLYAKMLLDKAVNEKNPGKYILAILVKADFSFVKQDIRQDEMYAKSRFFDVDGDDYQFLLENPITLESFMQQGKEDEVLWLGKGEKLLSYMALLKSNFSFGHLESLGGQNIKEIQDSVIQKLKYEKDVKKPGQPIYSKDGTELEQEANGLRDKLRAFNITLAKEAKRLLIVKDMDIAAYPHQLFVDADKNEFVGQLIPSCNIISTEVLIKTNFEQPLTHDLSCAFWMPLDSEDFTFAMIKSKLDNVLTKYNFACNDQTNPLQPINSEINIACAHGGVDISNTSWFYADDKAIVETDKIIGKGKLLILFICYSGTITRPDYDNAMHTLIKRYIRNGYSSVIAPMWSLNTEILHTWLSVFMSRIEKGDFVIDALFKANMAVKKEFISPAVYACLHLFGNPFLQIRDEPILKIGKEG